MKSKLTPIFALLILALVTLACGPLGGGKATPTSAPEPTNTPPPPPTSTPRPTNTPEPTPMPEAELGEEYRSEEGGYAFRVIPDYTVEGAFGITSMEAPNADPDTGPAIFMMGGVSEEGVDSPEQLFDNFTSELEAGVEVSEPRDVMVGGAPGVSADVSGIANDKDIAGRIVFVVVTPDQQFTMIGAAPAERWEGELEPLFEAVLASVSFFEPAGEPEPTEEAGPGAETRQWASSAAASSEYGDTSWAASQVTGAPDTPECGDATTAWAASGYDTVEWIELSYDTPVLPTEVNIIQTYNPDQVVSVELLDTVGEYHTIYTGEPEDMGDDCPYILSIPVEGADYQVVAVKITIDQSVLQDWNEIDAVELVGVPEHPVTEP